MIPTRPEHGHHPVPGHEPHALLDQHLGDLVRGHRGGQPGRERLQGLQGLQAAPCGLLGLEQKGPGQSLRGVFISSHAVYRHEGLAPGSDEDAPCRPPVRDTEELNDVTYGPLKVACEDDVLARYGAGATIVRPGKVAGPHDPQDGLTYWVRRAARGGPVALPTDPTQPVQVIDSRDLGRLVVQLLADDRPGVFHAVGPAEPVTLGGLIETCARVAGTQVEIVPVPPETAPPLFPLVRPYWPSQQRSPARARAAGMPATPLAVTVADVLAWDRSRGEPTLSRGFSPEQEQAVLARQAP